MGKPTKRIPNVILRGDRYYIRVPANAVTNERRRVATWIAASQPGGAQAAAAILKRIESVISGIPPRWDLLEALHASVVTLKQFDDLLIRHGVEALNEKVVVAERLKRADESLVDHAVRWPALSPKSTTLPERSTLKLRRRRVEGCAAAIGTVGALTTAAIQEYLATCGKPATQRSYCNDIKMFCAWLMTQGVLATNPAEGVVLAKTKDNPIKAREFAHLMVVYNEMTPGPARDAFGFMNATAAETSMCQTITHAHADAYREVNVAGGKNAHRNRQAVIEAWFMPRFRELLASTPRGQALMPATRFTIAKELREAVDRVIARDTTLKGLRGLRPYDARHSWAVRWLRDKKASIGMVSAQLGHKNNVMVMKLYGRYIPSTDAFIALDPEDTQEGAGG